MSKITGLEAPNQVPPKVTAMYRAVSTLLREDKDISEMSVSMITVQVLEKELLMNILIPRKRSLSVPCCMKSVQ